MPTYLESGHAHRVGLAAEVQLRGEALDVHGGVHDRDRVLQVEVLDELLESLLNVGDTCMGGCRTPCRTRTRRGAKKEKREVTSPWTEREGQGFNEGGGGWSGWRDCFIFASGRRKVPVRSVESYVSMTPGRRTADENAPKRGYQASTPPTALL